VRRIALRAGVLGGVLVVLVLMLEVAPQFERAREMLRDGYGPEGSAGGRSAQLLRELGVEESAAANWSSLEAENAPSSRVVTSGMLHAGQWLVSIAVPEESLRDPARGILANPEGRGRDWERVAWVSLYDGQRLVLATRAGLRFHGSSGRDAGREAFRVILRPSYGIPGLPADGPLVTEAQPPDRFVIRRFQTMPQVQPVAFDLARRIGAPAPASHAVRFVLNGSLRPQAYELSEHVSPEGWARAFFGHDDIHFNQFRALGGEEDPQYAELREWVADAPAPLRMTQVAERIDVDLFIRHVFTIMYCGTFDWAQGAAVLDLRNPQPRWFWVLWDLDQSFWSSGPEPWTRPSLSLFTEPQRPNEASDVRAVLLRRLLREDPAFVDRFNAVVSHTLNHALNAGWRDELLRRYAELAVQDFPFGGFDLETFFNHRGDEIFDAVASYTLRARPPVVRVHPPPGTRLEVDGTPYASTFQGRYFVGQTMTVRALDAEGRPRALWRVNGTERIGDPLEVRVEQETSIAIGN